MEIDVPRNVATGLGATGIYQTGFLKWSIGVADIGVRLYQRVAPLYVHHP